jgi:hypothetical protein
MGNPKAPAKAIDAGKAKAGQAIDLNRDAGKPGQYNLGSVKVKRSKFEEAKSKFERTHKIAIKLQYEDPQKDDRITMPDGKSLVKFQVKVGNQTYEGDLNEMGEATIEGIPEGQSQVAVSFPEIDDGELEFHSKSSLK